jgi:hypothetical protein
MDRYKFQFMQSIVPELVVLDGYFVVGAGGSVTGDGLPIWVSSFVHNSTGNYTLTMTDLFNSFGHISVSGITDNDPTDVSIIKVVSQTLGSITQSTQATVLPTIVLQVTSGGSAVDPAPNSAIQIQVTIHNSASL